MKKGKKSSSLFEIIGSYGNEEDAQVSLSILQQNTKAKETSEKEEKECIDTKKLEERRREEEKELNTQARKKRKKEENKKEEESNQKQVQVSEIVEDEIREEKKEEEEERVRKIHKELEERLPPLLTSIGESEGEEVGLLEEKIKKAIESKYSLNKALKKTKEFSNPRILDKLLSYCEIKEHLSNYPTHLFNPQRFEEQDFYPQLKQEQENYMDKLREALYNPKTNSRQIQFVTSSNNNTANSSSSNSKKSSRWDLQK